MVNPAAPLKSAWVRRSNVLRCFDASFVAVRKKGIKNKRIFYTIVCVHFKIRGQFQVSKFIILNDRVLRLQKHISTIEWEVENCTSLPQKGVVRKIFSPIDGELSEMW